jgi:hypothetical protein
MGLENVRTEDRRTSTELYMDEDERRAATQSEGERTEAQKDYERLKKLHRKLFEWYQLEREKQAANRYQMALDVDFYDGLQWDEQDVEELLARGQAALVFNHIASTVDWIIGTEKRTRVDFHVMPREEDDETSSQHKTKVMKWLSDVNMVGFHRSNAFSETIKAGLGWLEDGVRGDRTEEPIYSRSESWRNIIYDSSGYKEVDGQDARYLFRMRWTDLDIATAMFPKKKAELQRAAVAANLWGAEEDEDLWYLGQHFQSRTVDGQVVGRRSYVSDPYVVNNRRERVKLIEAWWRDPEPCYICHGEVFNGQKYDAANPTMKKAAADGAISLFDAIVMQTKVAVMTDDDVIYEAKSPYKHDRFPFTPIFCYRRGRDGMPYGPVRRLRDPQEDLNKRASKALFILSTNRIIADHDALDGTDQDWDDVRAEAARPDALIVKKRGSELKLERDVQLAEEHLMLMDRDAVMIQKAAGITDDNLGRRTNAVSGEAIRARQEQGSVVTAEIFDNLRLAIQLQGQLRLSLAEQFISAPKVLRLTGERGEFEWVKINQPEAQPDGSVRFINDITARAADFIVDEQSYSRSWREAMFNTLMDLLAKIAAVAPAAALQLLDLAFEFSDIPGKADFVARVRRIIGYVPEDLEKLTPEERAKAEAALKERAAAGELQRRTQEQALENQAADTQKKLAEAENARARAEEAIARAEQIAQDSQAAVQELLKGFREMQQSVQSLIPPKS